jgi:hypothetical protein
VKKDGNACDFGARQRTAGGPRGAAGSYAGAIHGDIRQLMIK